MKRLRNFFQGASRPNGQKTVWTFFWGFFLFILVLNLLYSLQRGSNGFITETTLLFQGFRGGPTFSKGGGGFQMLISIETHITCDFPGLGGSGPPIPLSGSAHERVNS